MLERFKNRKQAGEQLAEKLSQYAYRKDVCILALPRGGVPVAFEVAKKLDVPLDVFLVRKLGVPGHEELAMGAIASGGIRILNHEVMEGWRITEKILETITAKEKEELLRREQLYRGNRLPIQVQGQTVIIVDDGLATGSTMFAAITALRQQHPQSIVVAVPVAANSTFQWLRGEANEVVAVLTPDIFYGVGQWYEDFSQTSDTEVQQLLEAVRK